MKVFEKLNLGPRTTDFLSLFNLPNTTEIINYSKEELIGYKLPPKSIREIEEQLDEKKLKFKDKNSITIQTP